MSRFMRPTGPRGVAKLRSRLPLLRSGPLVALVVLAVRVDALLSGARGSEGLARLPVHGPQGISGDSGLAEAYVLTVDTPRGRRRLQGVFAAMEQLAIYSFVRIAGLVASQYASEDAEERQGRLPMSELERREWLRVDVGMGPVHHGTSRDAPPSGALACALGHRHIWELARSRLRAPGAARWALVLEDDARISPALSINSEGVSVASGVLREVLARVPQDAEIVFLDDRHCGGLRSREVGAGFNLYATGSTAYAITASGAAALLAEPFSHNADHWLNAPINRGKIRGYCPHMPIFVHNFPHASTIDRPRSPAAPAALLASPESVRLEAPSPAAERRGPAA